VPLLSGRRSAVPFRIDTPRIRRVSTISKLFAKGTAEPKRLSSGIRQLLLRPLLSGCWLTAAALGSFANASDPVASPSIVLAPANTPQASFEVRGLPPEVIAGLRTLAPRDPRWVDIFSVRVGARSDHAAPGMLGSYELTNDGVRLRSRFPLERGLEYRAVFDWPVGRESPRSEGREKHLHLAQTFTIPALPSGEPARALAVYPSAKELPENLLRLYIQFSAPMSQGHSYGHVHLRDESAGSEVERPFLELPQELWSPDGTRLTLLFEPGRVKHDLVPREQLGAILISGRTYSLAVDADWPDAQGRPLQAGMRKTFRALPADTRQLDPAAWKIETPSAGTREALSVRFPKPLDRAMLERVLDVARSDRSDVVGTIRIAEDETRWIFEPSQPWSAGRYVLAVSSRLEDPCGNSIGRPFEVDLKRSTSLPEAPPDHRIEFDVRAK
jgi:hypothetical protein